MSQRHPFDSLPPCDHDECGPLECTKKKEKPARPWRLWNGQYQKEFYDVRIQRGKAKEKVYLNCWPNAGCMNTTDGTNMRFRKGPGVFIRLAVKPMFRGNE